MAILGSVVTAGLVSAQSSILDVGGADVSIDLPGGGSLPDVGNVLPACANGKDDDGDGAVDLDDPGCSSPVDKDESNGSTSSGGSGGGNTGGSGSNGGSGGKGNGGRNLDDINLEEPFDPDKAEQDHKGPADKGERGPDEELPTRSADGAPTNANPTLTVADYGAAPIGVPNFIIDRFSIPPFLLGIYQACGTEYGIPWQILASINRIETAFGTNLNVSSAGAVGWMQFMPATWKAYGVDANSDGRKDPFNPVDAICGAARYLKASGGQDDLRTAIFAYNHADWYVDEVILYADQYAKLPADLIGSLTGLTEGAHFPVAAKARYADDISEREAIKRAKPGANGVGNVSDVISDSPTRRGINIYSKSNAPVVAVNDGKIIKIGENKRLGKFIVLEDVYGNRFQSAELGSIAALHPVAKDRNLTAKDFRLVTPGKKDKKPTSSATGSEKRKASAPSSEAASGPVNTEDAAERLYALPERPENIARADLSGQLNDLLADELPGYETFKSYFSGVLKFDPKTQVTRPLREGSRVIAGTVLGRLAESKDGTSHLNFSIRPSGRGAKKIDPKPILDGWKLLEATAIYRAAGENPFSNRTSVGQILLESKEQLQRRVLTDSRIEIYSCGREDIQGGQIDRRILASLAYLAERGFRPTVTSLRCGHGFYTSSGNVSHHSSGNAVDIAQINGIPILGNQGKGSITEAVVLDLLKLQGSLQPAQIITLMDLGGPTFAMGDHADHIHLGFQPEYVGNRKNSRFTSILKPGQWERLVERIATIDQPEVPTKPSDFALPSGKGKSSGTAKRASDAHLGE